MSEGGADGGALQALARKALGPLALVDIREAWPPMWVASAYVASGTGAEKAPEVSVWAKTEEDAVRGLRGALRAMAKPARGTTRATHDSANAGEIARTSDA